MPEEETTNTEIDLMLELLSVFVCPPFDREREQIYFRGLIDDFPEMDILETMKDFQAWILDNSDKYDREHPTFHRRFRQWCARARVFQKGERNARRARRV